MGYNIAALRHLHGRWENEKVAGMAEDVWDEERVREKLAEGKKKRKRVEIKA